MRICIFKIFLYGKNQALRITPKIMAITAITSRMCIKPPLT